MIAVDTNILIYAELGVDSQGRHEAALRLMEKLTTGEHCIPVQVLAEFSNVCGRKKLLSSDQIIEKIALYDAIFETPQTLIDDLIVAQDVMAHFNLQYFDTLILAISKRAGATVLLSEDMQDGLAVDGLRVVNPFVAGNQIFIDTAL